MAKYTTQVKTICEQLNGFEINEDDYNANIEAAAPKIFDNYPIYDEAHRQELNQKILGHYYMYEIGQETYGQWKFRINQKMKEIMPAYNEKFKSEALFNGISAKDLFNNVDYSEVGSEIGNEQKDAKIEGNSEDSGISHETREQLGKEKERADYRGGETNTKNITGKEKDIEKILGSETDLETISGSEIDAKAGQDEIENENIDKISKHWESDTPQGTIANVENESYLTNFSKDQDLGKTKETTKYGSQNTKSFNNRQNENVKSFNNRQNENEHEFINREDIDTQQYNNRYDEHERSFENRKDNSTRINNNKNKRNETTGETATRFANNVRKTKGKNSGESYMDLIQKIRDIIVNIDMEIIHDLRFQFMGVL